MNIRVLFSVEVLISGSAVGVEEYLLCHHFIAAPAAAVILEWELVDRQRQRQYNCNWRTTNCKQKPRK